MYTTELRMYSLGAKEVAAADNCFAVLELVSTACSQTLNKTRGLSSLARYSQGEPTTVGLFKLRSPY